MYFSPHSVSIIGLVLLSKMGVPRRASIFFMVALKDGWEI